MTQDAYGYSSKPVGWDMPVPAPADGYVLLGSLFQAYPPAGYTWPEPLVAALRKNIDPMLCPMWCWYVYATPEGGTYREGRHWIWVEVGYPDGEYAKRKYLPATTGPNVGRHPNVQLLECAKKRTKEQELLGIGGDYMPFEWGVYEWLKIAEESYIADPIERADAIVNAKRTAREAANKEIGDDMAYEFKHEMKFLRNQKSKPSDSELAKFARYGNTRWEKKPFVHVRSER